MIPCKRIAEQMGGLFKCEEHNSYIRIRTPFLHPDGDVIDLFLREDNSHATLTDLGETVRWLRSQVHVTRRTKKQTRLIEDICQNNGVAFFKGMLQLKVTDLDLAEAVTRLGQACVQVSDIWFTFRTRAYQSTTEEVTEFLVEKEIPFKAKEPHPGRSGRTWAVDFHTRTRKSSFVQLLSTGTRGATHRIAEHVLAMWVDLSHHNIGTESVQFVSLFDDTVDVWGEEDFALLDATSKVVRWKSPEDLLAAIAP